MMYMINTKHIFSLLVLDRYQTLLCAINSTETFQRRDVTYYFDLILICALRGCQRSALDAAVHQWWIQTYFL